jgi:hypothetical protein
MLEGKGRAKSLCILATGGKGTPFRVRVAAVSTPFRIKNRLGEVEIDSGTKNCAVYVKFSLDIHRWRV